MAEKTSFLDRLRGWFSRQPQAAPAHKEDEGWMKVFTPGMIGLFSLQDFTWMGGALPKALAARYQDYEQMDMMPEVAASLDIYADDATQPNAEGRSIWIKASDAKLADELNRLLKALNMDNVIWGIARNLAKYGNSFEEVIYSESDGVISLVPIKVPTVRVIATKRGETVAYLQLPEKRKVTNIHLLTQLLRKKLKGEDVDELTKQVKKLGLTILEPFEVVHFKLQSRRDSVYGYSILEGNRWTFRYLKLMEDALLVHKLTRANPRYVVYFDLGNLTGQKARRYAHEIKMQFKRRRFVNPKTGLVDVSFNPFSNEDDIFIPVTREREKTRVDVLATPEINWVDDVDYFRKKQQSALKVPQRYLGGEEAPGRSTLSQEDMRFARSVMRLQQALKAGVEFLCHLHLIARGMEDKVGKFEVCMESPSAVFELAKAEVWSTRVDVASRLAELFSRKYGVQQVFGLSDDEYIRLNQERQAEKEQDAVIDAVAAAKAEAEAAKYRPKEAAGGRGMFGSTESLLQKKVDNSGKMGKDNDGIDVRLSSIEERLGRLSNDIGQLMKVMRFWSINLGQKDKKR